MSGRLLVPALLVACVAALAAACLLGPTPLGVGRVLAALAGHGEPGDVVVVWQVRLPRALAAFAAGAALGAGGAALQGLLRNPLAEPGVLGVSASAALGATAAIHFGIAAAWSYAVPAGAILGALAATGLIAAASRVVGSVVTLILVGVALSSLAGALMSLLMNLAPHPFTLADMVNWLFGSVANRSFRDLGLAVPFLVGGLALLLAARRGLSVLTLGEEAGAGAGLDLRRIRALVIAGTGLATGAAVAIAGVVGFVGIVAPHVVRPFVTHDPARTLVPSALLAGLVLVAADVAVRTAPTGFELRLGVVAALVGAPFFVWIAVRRRTLDG